MCIILVSMKSYFNIFSIKYISKNTVEYCLTNDI